MEIRITLPDDYRGTFDAINATATEDHQMTYEEMCQTMIVDRVIEFRQQVAAQTFQEQRNQEAEQMREDARRGQERG